jgi:CHAT domain-containing protein
MLRYLLLIIGLFLTKSTSAQQYPPLEVLVKKSFEEIDSMLFPYYEVGNYEACIHFMNGSKEKAKLEFGVQDSIYASYAMGLGFFCESVGAYKRAESLFKEGRSIFASKIGRFNSTYSNSCISLGNLYQQTGKYNLTEALFMEAIEIYAKTLGKTNPEYATALNNLAYLYQLMGRYEQAEPLFREANQIYAETLGTSHYFYAKSITSLALLYQSMNDLTKAERLLTRANAIIAKSYSKTHPEYASAQINLALLYQKMEKYEAAEPLFVEVNQIYIKSLGKLHPSYATSLYYLARLYESTNRLDKAVELLLESNEIYAQTLGTAHPAYTTSLNYTTKLYIKTKQYDLAWGNIDEVLENLCDTSFITPVNKDWADYILKKSVYSYKQNSNLIASFTNAYDLMRLENRSKEELLIVSELSSTLIKTSRDNFAGDKDKLRMLEHSTNWLLKTLDILDKEKDQKQAFLLAEQNKAVLLLEDSKNERNYRLGNFPDSLVEKEQNLLAKKDKLQANLFEIRPKKERDSLRTILNEINRQSQEFKEQVERDYPKYASFKYQQSNLAVQDIQKHMNDSTALIEYALGDSVIHIFYVDKVLIKWIEIPVDKETLENNIKQLHRILSSYTQISKNPTRSYQKYTKLGYWFYTNLLAPIQPFDNKIKSLIIVSDGELGHLPFESFLVEEGDVNAMNYKNLHYLIKDFNISYNYSATLWKQNKESKKPDNNHQILAMAANYTLQLDSMHQNWRLPIYRQLRASLDPLPAAQQEVAALELEFEGYFAYNTDASEAKIKAVASEYAVIHLATHGFLDPQCPVLSSLALTEDNDSIENNFWQAYEISQMNLHADLVVLSACETGYGKFEKGNGIASLARAFMYAGAPSLIVSLWQVNDQVTSTIMQNLYRNLANGMTKDLALRKAKLDYINNASSTLAHPAFWSPFILIGNEEAIRISKKGSLPYGKIGLLFGIGLLVLLWMIKKRFS